MELFIKLFGSLLVFVYHWFDRIVIHGYLSVESKGALASLYDCFRAAQFQGP